ncbi:MAG: lipid-A-disaccharide synthase [Bacteroidales bacterium]|nr:lipid-A-disaccharide synthase [Bacteroidales bacterium]
MRYYIIAGEASGDLHGANLMRALRHQDPEAEFRYWGGDQMRAVGGEPVRHIRDMAFMGFVEVLAHLPAVMDNIRLCKKDILDWRPDVLVTIDYPGFNLKMARHAHEHGIKTVHYISPQLWAWKAGRIKKMRRDLDRLCYILPFEQDYYKDNRLPQAVYVGHPLLDAVDTFNIDDNATVDTGRKTIVLLPGSRRQEIAKVLPVMLRLAQRHQEYDFAIAGMTLLGEDFYRRIMERQGGSLGHVRVIYNQTYSLLASAYAAVVCSGTATLETALFNVPQVVGYIANPLSVAIARRFVEKRIKYISLVNLIADAPVVTELIQDDMNDSRLKEEFRHITVDEDARRQMMEGYARVHTILGNAGASDRTAQECVNVGMCKCVNV